MAGGQLSRSRAAERHGRRLTARTAGPAARCVDGIAGLAAGYGGRTGGRRAMQLGKVLATGFVSDEIKAPADGEAGRPADEPDAHVPEASPAPAPEPGPAAVG